MHRIHEFDAIPDMFGNESINNPEETVEAVRNGKTLASLVHENGLMAAMVEDLRGLLKKKEDEEDNKRLQVGPL